MARVGGDEFAVLLDETSSVGDAEHLAGEIVELFDEPFSLAGRRLRVGASVGIAPMVGGLDDAREVEELVADADLAMYAAKQAGKGRLEVFEPAMRVRGGGTHEPAAGAGPRRGVGRHRGALPADRRPAQPP